MGKALYRKYRSRSLDEIIGQDHITQLLRQAIAADTISHAYLLTGPRGVGKTSTARVIAHAINQLPYEDESNHLDIVEIDAASNNGVEDVRDLREKVHIAPSTASKKVYIIDEVHMLSKAAFNALLKTLEEPPTHVVFILVTTDVEKLPQTIISRVQRFNFRTIPKEEIVAHLKSISDKESILIDDQALERIADYGEGSFRDSIGLLDQLKDSVAPATISLDEVNATLGATDTDTINSLLEARSQHDLSSIIHIINSLESNGVNAKSVANQLIVAITGRLSDQPDNLTLLDELTSLNLSRYPYLRLLIALSKDVPRQSQKTAGPKNLKPKHQTQSLSDKNLIVSEPSTKPEKLDSYSSLSDFTWSTFLSSVKSEAPAVAALLSNCEHEVKEDNLTIYTKQPFHAKRLQSAKYSIVLNKCLADLGFARLTINVSASAPPSNNSSVSAVTDIMGGGEEVSVDAV